MRAMAPPEITLRDIYRSIIPFVGVMIVALAIIMVFSRKSPCGSRHMFTATNTDSDQRHVPTWKEKNHDNTT